MGHVKDRWLTKAKSPTARHGTGKRWQVWYQVDGHEMCGGSFANREVAKKKLIELQASALRGAWVDTNDQTTVTTWTRKYASTRLLKPRTAERVESHIKNHVEPTPLGNRRIGKVRPSEAQAWVTDRAAHLAPRTLRTLVTLVRSAFNAAVMDHLAPVNPFQRVVLPKVASDRIVPLTVEQVAAVAETIRPQYRAMVITQAGLGLRIGELLALRVEDVDFLRRMVRVEFQVDRKTRELVAPKTARSRRAVPLPDVVSAALAEHLRQYPPTAGGLLFHTSTGRPYHHDWINQKAFVPAALKAGLPQGTSSHDLRHHYASVLLAAGESVIAVAERLGHDNANLVLSTYGHLLPNLEDRTRKAVDFAWDASQQVPHEAPTAQGRPQ